VTPKSALEQLAELLKDADLTKREQARFARLPKGVSDEDLAHALRTLMSLCEDLDLTTSERTTLENLEKWTPKEFL
jgi:hypothetical protein